VEECDSKDTLPIFLFYLEEVAKRDDEKIAIVFHQKNWFIEVEKRKI
jgi:hypothetical protein